MLNLIEKTKRN